MKRGYKNIKVDGRVQNFNPFQEIDSKTFNKEYCQKQSSLIKRQDIPKKTNNNINDQTGLKKAYNNTTDNGLYYHPDNRTLYIAGTKDLPQDVMDDLFIPFRMVSHSKRYKTANDYIQRNGYLIDKVVGHSLGGAVAMELNKSDYKRWKVRTYNAPLMSWNLNTDPNVERYRSSNDVVSMLDRGANLHVNKNSFNHLYNHEYQAKYFGDVGKGVGHQIIKGLVYNGRQSERTHTTLQEGNATIEGRDHKEEEAPDLHRKKRV